MKQFFILLISFLVSQLHSQETYSKVFDLDDEASRNFIKDMILLENQIITLSTQFCDNGTSSIECAMYTSFGFNGHLLNSKINDSIATFNGGPNTLAYRNDTLYHSVNHLGEGYRNTFLHSYNLDFSPIGIDAYSGPETLSNIGNQGICIVGKSMFIYGDVNNASGIPDSVQIIKTDVEGNELDRWYYSYGNSSLEINNFQATPDGNFAFILKIKPPAGPNNGFDGYQLMKVDTFGSVLDTFAFKDSNKQPNRILALSDGGFIFSSIDHPITGGDILTTGYGMINKMDSNMDTLEWSLILPNDQLVDGRHYRMFDYLEASNGDIVACGTAYDNTDTELATGIPDKNSTWNGFIIRISPDGEIKWLRLYKNNNDLLPHDEFGRFRPSRLNKIQELPTGGFVMAGDVFVNNRQISGINELETEAFHLWLLMVDEDGCLDDYDCEEIIRFSNSQDSVVSFGNHVWFYEEEEYFGGGNSEIGYVDISIPAYLYQDGTVLYGDTVSPTFYTENQKMYFWDEYYQDYIMYYDWQETDSYQIPYYDPFSDKEEIATVIVDSVSYEYFGEDSVQVQHIHILNSGTLEDYVDVVYEGIGAGYFGIKFLLGCGLCDDNPYTTKLRCFSNDTMTYQFVPYECDSTWLLSSTTEVENDGLKIYPNPTKGNALLAGLDADVEYELYTTDGNLVRKSISENFKITLDTKGMYFVKLKVNEKWVVKRIVRIE